MLLLLPPLLPLWEVVPPRFECEVAQATSPTHPGDASNVEPAWDAVQNLATPDETVQSFEKYNK